MVVSVCVGVRVCVGVCLCRCERVCVGVCEGTCGGEGLSGECIGYFCVRIISLFSHPFPGKRTPELLSRVSDVTVTRRDHATLKSTRHRAGPGRPTPRRAEALRHLGRQSTESDRGVGNPMLVPVTTRHLSQPGTEQGWRLFIFETHQMSRDI